MSMVEQEEERKTLFYIIIVCFLHQMNRHVISLFIAAVLQTLVYTHQSGNMNCDSYRPIFLRHSTQPTTNTMSHVYNCEIAAGQIHLLSCYFRHW